jgi:hypothetical protein
MIKVNPWEKELNEIRIKQYEETKDLSIEERVKRTNEKGQELAAKYGFKIGTPADRVATR